jgi:hydroxymethylbilane synthase
VVTPPPRIRIASRGSQLALWQAESVRAILLENHPTIVVDIDVIRTTGDRILDVPLARIGDRGLFTKEIDEALLDGRADLAVHSLKDVPTQLPDGLAILAVSEREDPRDVLIARETGPRSLDLLPRGASVGTSSLRRRAQLRHLRPDLQVIDLRGNLNTRLARLDSGACDAIILAAAGVIRLDWHPRISQFMPVESWLPAVGQGALAVVARTSDTDIAALLAPLHHEPTSACVVAERGFLRALEGGCQVPIGALATSSGDLISIDGFVSDLDGQTVLRESSTGPTSDSRLVGETLARKLIDRGAAEILDQIRAASAAPDIPAP